MTTTLSNQHLIATDLDRTLFPNGDHEYDDSMSKFGEMLAAHGANLAYVSGRSIELVHDGIQEFSAPSPDFIGASVGTEVWTRVGGEFRQSPDYKQLIARNAPGWNVGTVRQVLETHAIKTGGIPMQLQSEEAQREFKLSYYAEVAERDTTLKAVTTLVQSIAPSSRVIWSEDRDEAGNPRGLLDVLPASADKRAAVEYIMAELEMKSMDQLVFCGDSGNDIAALTMGGLSIVVRNGAESVKEEVARILADRNQLDRLTVSSPIDSLNGNYVSGILTGLIEKGLIDSNWAKER